MPTYQYRCDNCGHALQLFQSMSAEPQRDCPACQTTSLVRVISGGLGVIFKGSGFYVNDSKRSPSSSSTPKDGANDKAAAQNTATSPSSTPDASSATNDSPSAPRAADAANGQSRAVDGANG